MAIATRTAPNMFLSKMLGNRALILESILIAFLLALAAAPVLFNSEVGNVQKVLVSAVMLAILAGIVAFLRYCATPAR